MSVRCFTARHLAQLFQYAAQYRQSLSEPTGGAAGVPLQNSIPVPSISSACCGIYQQFFTPSRNEYASVAELLAHGEQECAPDDHFPR
ncbi:hypothetical protein KCP78_23380 [Salmonella enterica subsp. enterica]|nr:hypothetical protein KCP78_23380 [Salmonella enterica subsp. enterica]